MDSYSLKRKELQNLNLEQFYTISVIGKGSYAKVLLVKKKDTGKYYAMKVLKKQYISKKRQENHVKTERDILVELINHPFLVKLYATFQTKKKLYFVLEYCPGGELFSLLQKKKRLTDDQAKFFTAQLILAIEYLHAHNIVYRDLKPENVLIDAQGYLKITDFGLSRQNVEEDNVKTICGTPEYLAPEIIMKLGYGKAVDWWTLGSILYEMLTGSPPFYNSNRQELFYQIKFVQPKYPYFIDQDTKNLLENLLKKDPSKRLGSKNGAKEIKAHAWFKDVNWDQIFNKQIESFYLPKINGDLGLSNFDSDFTEIPVNSLDINQGTYKDFQGFSWNVSQMQQKQLNEDKEFIIE